MSSVVLSYWPTVACFCGWKSRYSMYNPRCRICIGGQFGIPGGALLYARNFALLSFPTTCCSAVANECRASLVNGCAPFCQAAAAVDSIILPLACPEFFNNDKILVLHTMLKFFLV
ncbi:hypothetical protein T03_4128 [Trichinella britovi]|uniref:Uncharacterized protein n=1 Tax=Trichinella britovi TaxID=45882 RepID=A0A0V1C3G0_TRIBR|nr:hypothetical protein T03_4128 [Trichinella britovi]